MQNVSQSWKPVPVTCPVGLTPLQWGWLSYPASLTLKFAALFGEQARFCLASEGLAPLLLSEQVFGAQHGASQAWVRHSTWHFQDQLWLAARTVIPAEPEHPVLLGLATRPIGHILFKDPNCQRVKAAYTWLTPASAEFHAIYPTLASAEPCWARRTLFAYGTDHIVISELFFPAFFAAMTALGVACP